MISLREAATSIGLQGAISIRACADAVGTTPASLRQIQEEARTPQVVLIALTRERTQVPWPDGAREGPVYWQDKPVYCAQHLSGFTGIVLAKSNSSLASLQFLDANYQRTFELKPGESTTREQIEAFYGNPPANVAVRGAATWKEDASVSEDTALVVLGVQLP